MYSSFYRILKIYFITLFCTRCIRWPGP